MLFGKNKELRDEVDDWIFHKAFYHEMIKSKDEKRQLIIDKILNKKEKKDFENFWNIYKQIPGKYDFDSLREDRINILKKTFFENKDNPDIVGVALNASNQIINDVSTYCVSEFIRVEPGQYYSLRNDKSQFGSYGLCFYDKNKTYISGISFSTVHNNGDFIRTPAITLGDSADCVYIKTSYDSTKEALAIYKG